MPVCSGEGLTLDARGALTLDVCGSPERQDWPYTPSINTYNPIRRSSTGGCLWAEPLPQTSLGGSGANVLNPGTASSGSPVTSTVLAFQINNTDTCRASTAAVTVQLQWDGLASAGCEFQFNRKITGVANPDGVEIITMRTISATARRKFFQAIQMHKVTSIAASGSQIVTVEMQVNVTAGTFAVSRLAATLFTKTLPL